METLHALGHAGSDSFVGLEIIPLDKTMERVSFNSDEFTAVCPVTGQPDLYDLQITLESTTVSIESKSLKLYLNGFREEGCFCENLASQIKRDVEDALSKFKDKDERDLIFNATPHVWVEIVQKARGGISITATTL